MSSQPEEINRADEFRAIYAILEYARSSADKIEAQDLAKAIGDAMHLATQELVRLSNDPNKYN
ncbi:MAG: hypothetical protein AAF566_05030 [Pseudomonadota bacterium]